MISFLLLEFYNNYPSHSNHKKNQLEQVSTPIFDESTRVNCSFTSLVDTRGEKTNKEMDVGLLSVHL